MSQDDDAFTKIEDLIIKGTGLKDDMMDAMTHAMLYGSAGYSTYPSPSIASMMKGRGVSKAIPLSQYGTITGRIKSNPCADLAWIDDIGPAWAEPVIHVFHHTKGYMEIKGRSHHKMPGHSYALVGKQWYQRGSSLKPAKRIHVSKVPAEHRLFLMVNHIDQPKE